MIGSLASEWLKIRSVRSSWVLLGIAGLAVLFGAWMAYNGSRTWDTLSADQRERLEGATIEQVLLPLLFVCAGVFGALGITAEYASGTIRPGVIVQPRRLRLLAAKAMVTTGCTLLIGLFWLFTVSVVSRTIVGGRPISAAYVGPFSDQIPLLLASGLLLAVVGLVAHGLGLLLRSTAGALIALTTLLFVVPGTARLLPEPWGEWATSVTLTNLARQLADIPESFGSLSPVGAIGVVLAYLICTVGFGTIVTLRRDIA